MRKILEKLSESAIELKDIEYTSIQIQSKWIGNQPASNTQIEKAEQRIRLKLPIDYKKMLVITNGFTAPNSIEPNFLPVEQIDFLKNVNRDLIDAYSIDGLEDVGNNLRRSILIAGLNEEQHFLLIPPQEKSEIWKYWKFANWIPGEEEYTGIENYLKEVLDFNLTELKQID